MSRTVSSVLLLIAISSLLLAMLSLVVLAVARFRRARGAERQQFKWLAWSLLVMVLVSGVGVIFAFGFGATFGELMINWSIVFPVVGIGMAILRYRLYDIDTIINRTLVYGALTAALSTIYGGSLVLLQYVVQWTTGAEQSDLVTVAATLASAALFQPLRRRLQVTIDRRFYRRRYDAAKTLQSFNARVRDEVDLNELADELLNVVEETMQPAHVSLWLRQRGRSV